MDRLISEKSLLDKIDEWKGFDTVTIRLSTLRDIVKAIPSAEPKTGHWINIDDIESECSECGHREPNERFIFEDINFCAKCGAKMFEPQKSEDKYISGKDTKPTKQPDISSYYGLLSYVRREEQGKERMNDKKKM